MANTSQGRILQFCNSKGITVAFYNEKVSNGEKWCYQCRAWKKAEQFGNDSTRYDGKKANCFDCNHVKVRVITKGRRSQFKGKKHSPEVISIFRKINAGSNNPNWKGGKTNLITSIRNTSEYKRWRLDVYFRDDFTCQKCGVRKSGNNIVLDADHIKPLYEILDEYNIITVEQALSTPIMLDVNNGRCMCRGCHKETDTWGVNRKIKTNG